MAYALGKVHKTEHKNKQKTPTYDENKFAWFLMQYIRQPAGDSTEL